jgi:hypothetical protein
MQDLCHSIKVLEGLEEVHPSGLRVSLFWVAIFALTGGRWTWNRSVLGKNWLKFEFLTTQLQIGAQS